MGKLTADYDAYEGKDYKSYTAPIDGYYMVMGKSYRFEPNGKMKEVKNPARRWYQFWKPRKVMQPDGHFVEILDQKEIKFLKAGQSINTTFMERIM